MKNKQKPSKSDAKKKTVVNKRKSIKSTKLNKATSANVPPLIVHDFYYDMCAWIAF